MKIDFSYKAFILIIVFYVAFLVIGAMIVDKLNIDHSFQVRLVPDSSKVYFQSITTDSITCKEIYIYPAIEYPE